MSELKNCCYILVSGSRSIENKSIVFDNLEKAICKYKLFKDYEKIIFVGGGCCKGVDSFLKEFAKKWDCGYIEFLADWEKYGKSAGMIRNSEMIKYVKEQYKEGKIGCFCICVWDGKSNGTRNVIEKWGKNNICVVRV